MPALTNNSSTANNSCPTNSEPFALQNLGKCMEAEFSENCIVIVDPTKLIHNYAYVVVRYQDELYFRQYLERGAEKFLICLNMQYPEIKLVDEFELIGCITQQKQRKQKPLHYYHLNAKSKNMDFSAAGKLKTKS